MIHPGAAESCNLLDDDCDNSVDEAPAVGAPTWYVDADGDTWGSPAATAAACQQPTGYVASGTDCDDADPAVGACAGDDDSSPGDDDDGGGTAGCTGCQGNQAGGSAATGLLLLALLPLRARRRVADLPVQPSRKGATRTLEIPESKICRRSRSL